MLYELHALLGSEPADHAHHQLVLPGGQVEPLAQLPPGGSLALHLRGGVGVVEGWVGGCGGGLCGGGWRGVEGVGWLGGWVDGWVGGVVVSGK